MAEALAEGAVRTSLVEGVEVLRVTSRGEELVICSAQGHLFEVADPFDDRGVYPVFDIEWFPSGMVGREDAGAARRIGAVRRLALGAAKFINACDLDVEGEAIGSNILRYACGGKQEGALRARFSSLTKSDLVAAFATAEEQAAQGRAGRARHFVDFVWGVNLSRALSQATVGAGGPYVTISMGRVQGPALAFIAKRETEIRNFVPTQFFAVAGTFEGNGVSFGANYSEEKMKTRAAAEDVRSDCLGKEGVVTKVSRVELHVPPPPPFSTGDLQKEAYRYRGYTPVLTLRTAERLYLKALISYPRTASQRLPASIDFSRILKELGSVGSYSHAVAEVLRRGLRPAQGKGTDAAHPAIYPTGERPTARLSGPEAVIFDLIAKRFIATFGEPESKEVVTAELSVGRHVFLVRTERTLRRGWSTIFGRAGTVKAVTPISKGDRYEVVAVDVRGALERGPLRYNQASFLEKMEKENIGTKSTRADTIATLFSRGYIEGREIRITALGSAVVEAVEKYAPAVLSTDLTRRFEEGIESLNRAQTRGSELMRETAREVARQVLVMGADEIAIGSHISSAATAAPGGPMRLGPCPTCKSGELSVVRSRKTGKRFVVCSRYSSGCRTSAPLPQRGTIRLASSACNRCGWPVVAVSGWRNPWRLCVNPLCPSKRQGGDRRPPTEAGYRSSARRVA